MRPTENRPLGGFLFNKVLPRIYNICHGDTLSKYACIFEPVGCKMRPTESTPKGVLSVK